MLASMAPLLNFSVAQKEELGLLEPENLEENHTLEEELESGENIGANLLNFLLKDDD
jgi:hypothetical protein